MKYCKEKEAELIAIVTWDHSKSRKVALWNLTSIAILRMRRETEVRQSLTTRLTRRSFMLAVWCQGDELSICPETFRSFILRSLPPPKTIFLHVSQSGGIGRTRFFNLLHRLLSLSRSLILWHWFPKSQNKRLIRTF